MCLQGIKQQIFDRLNNNEVMNNESYDFVDHCDYLELENITPKTMPRDNLNLLQMNVRGLVGKQNKLQSLLDNLENYSNIHCLLLCETWLTEETKKLIGFNNHNFIGRERKTKKGGGVGFLLRNELIARKRDDLCIASANFEHCIIEIKCRKRNVILVSLYRPPNTSVKSFLSDYAILVQNLNMVKNCDVIIGMDHNLDLLKSSWHMDTQKFIELNLESNLLPCITRPTRITKSTATLIDNVLISKNLQGKQDSKILITDISDHLPSIITINGNFLEKKQKREIISGKITDKTVQAITDVLARHDWENDLRDDDVDSNFTRFHAKLLSTLNKVAPERKIKLSNKQSKREPWIGPSLLKCSTKQRKYYKEALKNKDIFQWEKYKAYKKFFDRVKHYMRIDYYKNKCVEFKNNSKKLWNMINKISGKNNDKTSIIDYIKVDSIEYYDSLGITNNLCKYFANIGENLASKIPKSKKPINEYLAKIQRNDKSLFLRPTSEHEINKIIDKLPNKNSSGHDNISNILLKKLKAPLLKPLNIVFNQSITSGIFPEQMKLANVFPLHKGKEKFLPTNYRPISLLLTISKVLEKIIYTRTYSFLNESNQLYVSQYGFRNNHSCENAVSELVGHILKQREQNESTACVFLDLSKAFDTIKHDVLLKKLETYGIRGTALDWFESYLTNRKIKVKCTVTSSGKTEFSNEEPVKVGTPQGSCLGPLIFLIFNNDLHKVMENCSAILFADDTTLYISSKNTTYLKWCIEHDISLLLDWFRANKLTLNLSKTQFLLFKTHANVKSFKIEIQDIIIHPSNNCKFLGITLDEKLHWTPHINDKILKIKRNKNMLQTSVNCLTPSAKKLIYYGHIHSHLTYCLLVWGGICKKGDLTRLSKIQNKCVKLIEPRLDVNTIYKKHKILRIDELIRLEEIKFGYKQINKLLPNKLQYIVDHDSKGLTLMKTHAYNTRNKKIPNCPSSYHQNYRNSFLNKGIVSYSNLLYQLKFNNTLSTIISGFKRTIFDQNNLK